MFDEPVYNKPGVEKTPDDNFDKRLLLRGSERVSSMVHANGGLDYRHQNRLSQKDLGENLSPNGKFLVPKR